MEVFSPSLQHKMSPYAPIAQKWPHLHHRLRTILLSSWLALSATISGCKEKNLLRKFWEFFPQSSLTEESLEKPWLSSMFKSLLKWKKPFDLYQLYYQTIAFFIFFSKEISLFTSINKINLGLLKRCYTVLVIKFQVSHLFCFSHLVLR